MTASPGLVGSLAPAVPPGHCPNEGSRHRPARLRLASPSGARVGAAPPSSSAGARARSFRGLRWFPGAASRRFEVRAAEVLQLWSVASAPSVWCACRGCRAAVECDSPSALPARFVCSRPPSCWDAPTAQARILSGALRAPHPALGGWIPVVDAPLDRSTSSTSVPDTHRTPRKSANEGVASPIRSLGARAS